MEIKKKIVTFGLSTLLIFGSIVSVMAYVYQPGTKYQTVTHKDIPNWGGRHFDTYYGSQKVTTEQFGTVMKTYGDAALGNFGGIIDANKKMKSDVIGLRLNIPDLVSELSCSKGIVYFSVAAASSIEPSNSCDVTMKFSADNLKPK